MNQSTTKFVSNFMAPKTGKTAKVISMLIKSYFVAHNIGLTKEQFIILLCLEEGAKTQSSLTLITERDKGSLTRLIQTLEKKSLIKRSTLKEDNRVNEVEITVNGKEILEQTKPIMKQLFTAIQQGIGAEEMEVAASVLEQMQLNAFSALEKLEINKK